MIFKVTVTTSSPTLSLSHPDPDFHLTMSIRIFHSPRPEAPITISTGRSAFGKPSELYFNGFQLACITDENKSFELSMDGSTEYFDYDPAIDNRDLKEMEWTDFFTIPASGSVQIKHALPLERMLLHSLLTTADLQPGMRYRVWMKQRFLERIHHTYWGDLEGDLKEKKLSNYESLGWDNDGSEYLGIEGDGWALQGPRVQVRGNVGRHGPVFEFVE